MKVAVITHKNIIDCSLYTWLKKVLAKRKIKGSAVERFFLEDIVVQWDGKKINLSDSQENILDCDIFLFRLDPSARKEKSYFLARVLQENNKIVINESNGEGTNYSDKLNFFGLVEELKINHPLTYLASNFSSFKEIINSGKITFPFIIKDHLGWQGSSVKKIDKPIHYKYLEDYFPAEGIIVQEYLPIEYDIRVLVVGYQALGAVRRYIPEGDFRSNLSLGAKGESIALTEEMKSMAEKIAQRTKNCILGVDFIEHNGQLYILEINECAGFGKFMKYSGIDPMKELVSYLVQLPTKSK